MVCPPALPVHEERSTRGDKHHPWCDPSLISLGSPGPQSQGRSPQYACKALPNPLLPTSPASTPFFPPEVRLVAATAPLQASETWALASAPSPPAACTPVHPRLLACFLRQGEPFPQLGVGGTSCWWCEFLFTFVFLLNF